MRNSDSDHQPGLSELDIQAYVDGKLDAYQASRVDHYLGSAPEEAHRVAFYHRLNRLLKADFPKQAEPANTRGIRRVLQARGRRRKVTLWSLGALAATLCLGGLAYTVRPLDLLMPVGVMALEDGATAASVSMPVCVAGAVPCAAPLDLSRVGFRAALVTSTPLFFFFKARETVYRNQAGEPAVLLSVPNWSLVDQPQWQARRVGTIRVLSWTHGGRFYIFAGQDNTRGLMKAADLASSNINK